jgi:hypothetical protein
LTTLAACESAYKADDREQFMKDADRVMRLAAFVPGSVIRWRGADKQLRGPAAVSDVHYEKGRLWACVIWAGYLTWVNDLIIANITVERKDS